MDLRDQFQHLKVELIVVTLFSPCPNINIVYKGPAKSCFYMFTSFTCEYKSVRKAALCDLILLILTRDSKVTGVYKN